MKSEGSEVATFFKVVCSHYFLKQVVVVDYILDKVITFVLE